MTVLNQYILLLRVPKKSLDDGDMSKILSFKYQTDFVNEMNERNLTRQQELVSTISLSLFTSSFSIDKYSSRERQHVSDS